MDQGRMRLPGANETEPLIARMRHRHTDLLCLLFIVLIATAFLGPALEPGNALLPLQKISQLLPWSTTIDVPLQNTTLGDPFFAFYPRRLFFTEAVRDGELPFWNPYMLGGYPAVGDTNAQTFYPPNWLAASFLSPARSFAILAWFHLALTGAGMYLMLRSHRLQPASSLLGAVAWMLSGILVVWLEHPHRLSSFAWLPILFWVFNVGRQRRRLLFPFLGGITFALMILGGQPQYAEMAGLLLAAYALVFSVRRGGGRWRWDWWPSVALAVVAGTGLGIGALQLLPTYDFLAQSHREPRAMDFWLLASYPPRQLVTFWIPDFFGTAEAAKYPFWGQRMNYVEYTFYYGAAPFLLSLMAPALSRQKRLAWLWWAVIGLSVLIAIGTPLAYLAKALPGMDLFSLHRMLSHVPFLGSWLAAMAFDGLLAQRRASERWRWWAGALLLLVLATAVVLYAARLEVRVHWPGVAPQLVLQGLVLGATAVGLALLTRWRRAGVALVLVIVVADLFGWGHAFNPVASLDLLYPSNEVTEWLETDQSIYRILPLRNGPTILGENIPSVFHLGAPDGYLALMLRYHKELMYTIDPYYENDEVRRFLGPHVNLIVAEEFSPLHSILNVKYVLSSVPLSHPLLVERAHLQGVYLYENEGVLPRAYPVHRVRVVPDEQMLAQMVPTDWEPSSEAILSQSPTDEALEELAAAPVRDDSTVQITHYGRNRIELAAEMEHPGLVVLADPYCRGWQATVDGEPVEILRANHAQRAILVDAGAHQITLAFRPLSVRLGVAAAVATVVVGVIIVVIDYRRTA